MNLWIVMGYDYEDSVIAAIVDTEALAHAIRDACKARDTKCRFYYVVEGPQPLNQVRDFAV